MIEGLRDLFALQWQNFPLLYFCCWKDILSNQNSEEKRGWWLRTRLWTITF